MGEERVIYDSERKRRVRIFGCRKVVTVSSKKNSATSRAKCAGFRRRIDGHCRSARRLRSQCAKHAVVLNGSPQRMKDNPPLEGTSAAVYFTCGRASRVRRRGRSTAFR